MVFEAGDNARYRGSACLFPCWRRYKVAKRSANPLADIGRVVMKFEASRNALHSSRSDAGSETSFCACHIGDGFARLDAGRRITHVGPERL